MSSVNQENEEPTSSGLDVDEGHNGPGAAAAASEELRPPAKRPISTAVIEISDTESDDSDICAVTSYQASADEVKRIRGADYSSSSSSSSDYSSDSESPWEDDSVVIQDEKVSRRAVKAQLYPRANRMEDPKLNSQLQSQELIDRLKSHWLDLQDLKSEEVTLTCEPFRLCLLHNLLSNADIINNIVDDMNTLDWARKKMDLYEFHQTADLASLTWQRSIRGIYQLLKTEVMKWVSEVTGLTLTSVSASCSLYGPGDHLLVHDDLLGDRRVAFILYLAPWQPAPDTPTISLENGGDNHVEEKGGAEGGAEGGWRAELGGALELFSKDEAGPSEPARAVYPRNNMLAFFQVTTDSYHQVAEVVSMELPRLSINGWFHGPAPEPEPAPAPAPPAPPAPELHKPHSEVVLLNTWVQAAYLAPRQRAAVQAQMERESEVCLHALLHAPRLRAVRAALQHAEVPWQRVGPANQRRYELVPPEWLAALPREHVLAELVQLFSSSAFSKLLHDCTDLALHHYSRLQLQRWQQGDYTLLPPREHYATARLEALLHILDEPERAWAGGGGGGGGATVFLAPEEGGAEGGAEDGALVALPPVDNALGLVYCDAGAAAFTKYLSRLAVPRDACFYVLACTYSE